MTEIAFLFSGKGSQHYHMGHSLYQSVPRFRAHLDRLDRLVRVVSSVSVLPIVFDGAMCRALPIADPEVACLSIFMMEAALARTLMEAGVIPGLLVGSSMGIYAAAVAAGSLDEEEAIACLAGSAKIFRTRCQPGSLTTVLGAYGVIAANPTLTAITELAAINFPSHCVIASLADDNATIHAEIARLGFAFQPLSISRPYHSRWIEPARSEFLHLFEGLPLRPASIPIACCSGPLGLRHLSGSTIWQAIRRPMMFQNLVERLEALGSWRYVDVGPSGTLATCLKYMLDGGSGSSIHTILSPAPGDTARLHHVLALRENGTSESISSN